MQQYAALDRVAELPEGRVPTMNTFEHFLQKRGINHDEAFNAVVNRFANLVIEADLAVIDNDHFRTLCQLVDGIDTRSDVNGKATFVSAIKFAWTQQNDFRKEIKGVTLADDTPESRAIFMAKLDTERKHLRDLLKIVQKLTAAQAIALLERVEEVLCAPGEVGEEKLKAVYEKMQTRSRL